MFMWIRSLLLLLVGLSLGGAVHHEGDFIPTTRRGQFLRVSYASALVWTQHLCCSEQDTLLILPTADENTMARLDRASLPKVWPDANGRAPLPSTHVEPSWLAVLRVMSHI